MSTAALDLRSLSRGGALAAAVAGGAVLLGVLAAFSPLLALGTTLGLLFVGVTLRSLPAGLAVFTVLTFFERIPGVSGSASLVKVAGVVLAGSWLLALLRRGSGAPVLLRDHPALSYAVVAFCGWAIASMLWAPDVEIARFNASRLVQVVVFLFIVYTALGSREHVRWVVLAFMSGAALTALVGLGGATSAESFDPEQETSRLVGQIGDPNELAAILIPALAFVVFSLGAFRSPLVRWLLCVYALVLATALFLTESRGGIVGFLVMSLAAVALAGRLRPRVLAAVLTIAALGVGYYALVAPPESLQRVTDFAAEGGTGRTDLWSIALEVAEDHPVAGVGIGNFVVVEPTYASQTIAISQVRLVVDDPKIAHNMYLQVLSELGLVGLVLFLGVLGASLTLAWRSVRAFARAGDESMELIARGLIVGLLGMLAAYMFISAQYEKQLWLLFGVSTALYSVARRGAAVPAPALGGAVPPRRERLQAPGYDPGVSERLVEQLEQRLTERLDALLEEQERLERRRSALGAREQELRERARLLDEQERERRRTDAQLEAERAELDARAHIVRTLELAHDGPGPEGDEQERRDLEERVARAEERERRLAVREAAVEEAERGNAELRSLIETMAAREEALASRAAQVEARLAELGETERRIAEAGRAAESAAARGSEVEQTAQELASAQARLAEERAAQREEAERLEAARAAAERAQGELRALESAVATREAALLARAEELDARAEELARERVVAAEAERASAELRRAAEELAGREAALGRREEQLERRTAELVAAAEESGGAKARLAELVAAEERLAEREAELERERAVVAEAQRAAEALVEREAGLARREAELEQRAAELDAALAESRAAAERAAEWQAELERERTVVAEGQRAAEDLRRREEELARRTEELAAAAQERDGAEARLAERVAAVTARELELARRAAALATQGAAQPEREPDAVTEPEPEPEPRREPEPEPEPEPQHLAVASPLGWTLGTLERLVAERGAEHPDRVEEWSYYLLYLRDFAEPSGALPDSFDGLVEDVFAELLDR